MFPRDLEEIKEIHRKFYDKEFDFSEFSRKYLSKFTVIENDKIVLAGGIRNIAEVVLVTDKESSTRVKRDALLEALEASKQIAASEGLSQIHAFIQDEAWCNHLFKYGFQDTAGRAVVLNF